MTPCPLLSNSLVHRKYFKRIIFIQGTVKPDNSKPLDGTLQLLVNFLLHTKISNYSINHMIDSKYLAIVKIFSPVEKFTKARFDCINGGEK